MNPRALQAHAYSKIGANPDDDANPVGDANSEADANSEVDANSVVDANADVECSAPPLTRVERVYKVLTYVGRALIAALIITALVLVSLYSSETLSVLEDIMTFIRDLGVSGVALFVVIYAVAAICWAPGWILTVGAGYFFTAAWGQATGIAVAILAVAIGAVIGASLAFLLGRTIFRGVVETLVKRYESFAIVDRLLEENGFKIVFLCRLSPVVPFNASNYIAGITRVRFWSFFFGSVGMLPGIVMYVVLGSTVSEFSSADPVSGTLSIVLISIGVVLAVAITVYISWLARREFRKEMRRAAADAEAEAS